MIKIKLTKKLWFAYLVIPPFFLLKIYNHFFSDPGTWYQCKGYKLILLFRDLPVGGSLMGEILLNLFFLGIAAILAIAFVIPFHGITLQWIFDTKTYAKVQNQVEKNLLLTRLQYLFFCTWPILYYNLNYLLFC
jgi:hypothetical protein|tara:strand:+ start:90 stop:491 length:402 start_codon:yes stop_codon:yes gene_type:complete